MSDAVIQRGIALVGDGLCPACDVTGHEVRLQASPPDGFHYHGSNTATPTRLFCPNDGQGYRLNDAGELRITVPCNGGLHPDGTVGPAPLSQTTFGTDETAPREQWGNCLSACIASILDLSVQEVPTFVAEHDWFSAMERWLAERGWGVVVWPVQEGPPWYVSSGVYGIASGPSPRGPWSHSVVVRVEDGQIVVAHDPNPSGEGLDGMARDVTFLVPLPTPQGSEQPRDPQQIAGRDDV